MVDIFQSLEELESKKFIHDQVLVRVQSEFDCARAVFAEQLHDFILENYNKPVCQQIVSSLYWQSIASLGIATVVKKAWKDVTGKFFVPDPYETEFLCVKCQGHLYVTSVSAYQILAKASYSHWCDLCKKERNQEQSREWELQCKAREERNLLLHTMPYAEYLETPEWNEARNKALKRAGYRCQLCSSKGELHVHHRTYERRGYELLSDLIVLCRKHHEQFHEINHA